MQRARRLALVMGPGLALVLGLACRQSDHEVARTPNEPADAPLGQPEAEQPLAIANPFVHGPATRFAPSRTGIGLGESPPNGARVADYDHCGSCHEEISTQWRTSAHSFASFNNPIYRASVDRFRALRGAEPSRFCAGCHDPALLVDGSMDAEIATDEPRAHVGVGCLSCHGVESSTYDGNGSYVLAAREIPIPEMEDEASIERHRASMGPARDQCGSCHRAFLGEGTGHPHHFNGTDEIGPWTDSSYTGSKLRLDTKVQEQDCADCHMPRQTVAYVGEPNDPAIDADGKLRSHRFIGAHSWLAAMRGDDETLARVREFLQGIASIDIAAIELDGERRLLGHGVDADARGRMVVDLVVRNLAVGHRFPGGTRDSQDTWLALSVYDARGHMVAQLDDQNGRHRQGRRVPENSQGDVHRLRTGIVDDKGVLVSAREVESLRAVAFDNTVGPRDAVIVRYAVELPRDAVGPLRIEARLLHRSRTLALADETCRQAQSPRGRAFIRATEALTGQTLDACAEQPVTEISRHALVLGASEAAVPVRPDHERLWELGIALQHQVQERLPEAREALAAAEAALDQTSLEPAEKTAALARILAALGAVATQQGRVDEALALADRVAALAPTHPYPHLLRGRALAKVWRWEQAIPHLERAFEVSPESPTLAGELAIAYGSAGMHREALAVAAKALPLRPRDATLLRAQALALDALEDPRAEAALEAYFAHREPDVQPHLGAECGDKDPACALERVPVHVHE
jgi:tetratricopeptide (TPR) repeat protein